MPTNEIYSLNEFFQGLKDTGLKLGYQFQVTIEELDNLQFYATSTTLPGKTLNVADIPYFGQNFKIPTSAVYSGEWTMSTRVDNALEIKKALDKWMDNFADLRSNGGGDKRVPSSTVIIDLLDSQLQNITDTFTLVGVWPSTMGDLTLDQSVSDPLTMDMTLQYQYWYKGTPGDSSDPLH